MDTIILFSRTKLAHLFGNIDKYLSKKNNIIHVAFSDFEENILKNTYSIKNIINFKKYTDNFDNEKIDEKLIKKIDDLFLKTSKNRFSLNSSIQSDRGFKYLSYESTLKLSQLYYKFWSELLNQKGIKAIFHETTSLLFNHMASVIAQSLGIIYSDTIPVQGLEENNFRFFNYDDGSSIEFSKIYQSKEKIDKEKVEKFLNQIRSIKKSFLVKKNNTKFKKLLINSLKDEARILFKKKDLNKDNIDYYLYHDRLNLKIMKNMLMYKFKKYFYTKKEIDSKNEKFYLYTMHLEPEAVVLYWGDGIYKNQVKLIENIAAQLPPNNYLYVKDHGGFIGQKNWADFEKLSNIPNIRIIDPKIPATELIKKSKGVLSINGTSTLEGLILNKHVYIFGNVFYQEFSRVHKIKNIKELRKEIYKNENIKYQDDKFLYKFIDSYLKSLHSGNIELVKNAPTQKKEILVKHSKLIANAFDKFITKL